MNHPWLVSVCNVCGFTASDAGEPELIQKLWADFGAVWRLRLTPPIVVKQVAPPADVVHSSASYKRKMASFVNEELWYNTMQEIYAASCSKGLTCVTPRRLTRVPTSGVNTILVLEDLDFAGFSQRRTRGDLSLAESAMLIRWLAHFHAVTLQERVEIKSNGLFDRGNYWHLSTRQEEFAATDEGNPLKVKAVELDQKLSSSKFACILHGDSKVANFCFGKNGVAGLDFQYAGIGAPVEDLAYLALYCRTPPGGVSEQSVRLEDIERLVALYSESLLEALSVLGSGVCGEAVVEEVRRLFPVAWLDYHRFLCGWRGISWNQLDEYTKSLLCV